MATKVSNDLTDISRMQSVDGNSIQAKLTWQWFPNGNLPQITIYRRWAGMVTGNHFHTGKDPSKNPELLVLSSGKVLFKCLGPGFKFKPGTKRAYEMDLDATDGPVRIVIPPNVLHKFVVLRDCEILEFRVTRFNPKDDDTFPAEEFPAELPPDW